MPDWICPSNCVFRSGEQPRLAQMIETQPDAAVTCPRCLRRYSAGAFREKKFGGPLHHHVVTQPVQRVERLHQALYTSNASLLAGEVAALRAKFISLGVRDAQAYEKVLQHLRRVRLTMNCPLKTLAKLMEESQPKFRNLFQLPHSAHTGFDVAKYFHERNQSEKTLFGVPELAPHHLPETFTGSAKYGAGYNTGLYNEGARSTPEDRPLYAALNIGCFAGGAAPMYGTSYFVLKNTLRPFCTFTAGDSLEHHWKKKLNSQSVGTDAVLHKVLLYMDVGTLTFLGQLATRSFSGALPAKYQQYVEAQIWKQIDFSTDIDVLCVDIDEINGWIEGRDLPDVGLWPYVKDREGRSGLALSMQTFLRIFCQQNHIELKYYKSGKSATLSYENAKVFRIEV